MKKSAQELYSSLWLPIGHGNFRMSRILFLVMISGKHFCSSLFKFYLVYLGDLGQPLNPLLLPLQVLSCLSRWSWTTSQPSAELRKRERRKSTLHWCHDCHWLTRSREQKAHFQQKKLTNFSKFCGVLKKVFKNHNIG